MLHAGSVLFPEVQEPRVPKVPGAARGVTRSTEAMNLISRPLALTPAVAFAGLMGHFCAQYCQEI